LGKRLYQQLNLYQRWPKAVGARFSYQQYETLVKLGRATGISLAGIIRVAVASLTRAEEAGGTTEEALDRLERERQAGQTRATVQLALSDMIRVQNLARAREVPTAHVLRDAVLEYLRRHA